MKTMWTIIMILIIIIIVLLLSAPKNVKTTPNLKNDDTFQSEGTTMIQSQLLNPLS